MLIIIKMILDISINVVNIRSKSNYSFNDCVKQKSVGFYVGIVMLILISVQVIGYLKFDGFIEKQLQLNGIQTTSYIERIYWHKARKSKFTGYKLEYYYKVGQTDYHHSLMLGKQYEFQEIKIKYLPFLPEKHSVVFL
jgi:hypothetical protein